MNDPSNGTNTPQKDTLELLKAGQADPALAYAWELYETYSNGSQAQKQANSGLRQQVIWLIFLTSVLAVAKTLPGVPWLTGQMLAGLDAAPWYPFDTRWLVSISGGLLSATLLILSVATSAALAFAAQFTPLKAWIMYRVGADRIRSEIYLYRMRAGDYHDLSEDEARCRHIFLDRIEGINQDIYELETAPPFLQLTDEEEGTYNHSTPRRWWNRVAKWAFLRWRANTSGKGRIQAIDPTQYRDFAEGKVTRLPGRYYAEHDNGFNELTIEAYIDYRVLPQRNWYVQKVYEDYEKIKDWRKVTLTIGGLSAVLAAISLEPYIVITTAAAVAINTHLQLNLIGNTYGNYHITASRIDAEVVRWRNRDEAERHAPTVVSAFVSAIEGILEAERSVWMQQASQAQQESEQSLIKGAGRRDPSGTTPATPAGPSTSGTTTPVASAATIPMTAPAQTPPPATPATDATSAPATTPAEPTDPTQKFEQTK